MDEAWIGLLALGIGLLLAQRSDWGPGTHITFARGLLTEDLDRIPRDVARLITAHEDHFLYGNIAADIISYKNYGGMKNHCHNWNIRERLMEHTDTDTEMAFVYGYLCHLAADVVAHQHFVPFHIVHGLPPRLMGHLYWEARADGGIGTALWERIDALRLDRALHESDRLILEAVPRRAFSHRTNKLIFNHVLLARSRRSWRAIIDQATARRPAGALREDFLAACHARCRENLIAVFREDTLAPLRERDPNGHEELAACQRLRRDLLAEYGTRARAMEASRHAAERAYGLGPP
ncbi:MAG: zinc dependent phospholipase C family protein [Planctomycetota bacterium]